MMQVKDYYSILDLPATATLPEIKRAYRRLAMVYHPDKTKEDSYALARFNEIKEAYEVLSNPAKKEAYLEQRWLYKFSNKSFDNAAITPPDLLKQCIELNRHIAGEDRYRMNHPAYASEIAQLLCEENITMLHRFNEAAINVQIFRLLLSSTHKLPLHLLHTPLQQLQRLAKNSPELLQEADLYLQEREKQESRGKYEWLWMVLLTLAICWLIFTSVR